MENLSAFLAQNAVTVEHMKYPASPRFLGKDGKPTAWEIRSITSAEDEKLRADSMRRVPVPGRKGAYTSELDVNQYLSKLAAACTVYPDLGDTALQDSYHVLGGEALLKTMLLPGEYAAYLSKIQEVCGFDQDFGALVDEAKN